MTSPRKLAAIVMTAGAVGLLSLAAVYVMGRVLISANGDLLLHHGVAGELREVMSTLTDAETGQRGYLLTGREIYLQPYNDAGSRIRLELEKLRGRPREAGLSVRDLERVAQLASEKLAELQKTILLRRAQGLPAALAIVMTDSGKHAMDSTRDLIAQMIQQQEAALVRADRRALQFVHYRNFGMAVGTLLSLWALVWAYRRIRDESAGREKATFEIIRQKELLDVTLASIGDAVIVTDVEGRITFMNKIAEQLTGFTAQEAHNRPCAQVFNLVHEASGQHLESPAERILSEDNSVDRANQTVLVRKDGSEISIDQSASSIRESDGTVRGVVLIFRDCTGRKRAERELLDLNVNERRHAAQLAAANKELEAFSYSVSHDLRSPLRSIDGFSLALMEDYADRLDETATDFLKRIRTATQRMAQLIDDLLNLARSTRGEMRHEAVDLGALAKGIIANLQKEDPQRVVEFMVDDGVIGQGDPRLLQLVLKNLLENAWKFTSKNARAHIELRMQQQDGRTVYCVGDDGSGFDMSYVGKLFGTFQRLHTANEFPGSGVGLAIVKRIINRHGGRTWAAGVVDGGATFSFTL